MVQIWYLSSIVCSFFLVGITDGVRDPHQDYSMDKHVKRYRNGLAKLPDSHKFLNAVQRWKKDPYVTKTQYSLSHLPYGYSHREEVDKMINQRDKHEKKTSTYINAAKILYQNNKTVAEIIFDRAKKHRRKSQNVHRELNQLRSQAKLDQIYKYPPYSKQWPPPGDYDSSRK